MPRWFSTFTQRSLGDTYCVEISPAAELAPEHRDWLAGLDPADTEEGVGLFHASPRDPIWEYVLSALLAELCFDAVPHQLSLIGHSHVALAFVRREGEPATGRARYDPAQILGDIWP